MIFQMGRYRALTPLGEQGRNRVWRADADDGGGYVVLDLDRGDRPVAALRRQFEIAGALRHPHLVPVVDLVEDAEIELAGTVQLRSALVTAYVEGGSLEVRLRDGLLEPAQLLTLLAGVAGALQACHQRGLVHGGLTPAWVLFTAGGRPSVAGLGVASAAAELGVPLTSSPGHASPEVARGSTPRAADDLFALGSIALECLTGRPAWPADELRDVTIQSEFGQWPTLDAAALPGVPTALSALVTRLLHPDPARRPSADEVLRELPACGSPSSIDVGKGSGAGAGSVTGSARHAAPDSAVELPPGIRWLDLEGVPGWAPDPPPAVDVPPSAPVSMRARGRALLDGRPSAGRWRGPLLALVVAMVIGAASIGGGIWWAGSEEPAATTVAPVADVTTTAAVATDWVAVVAALDTTRAAAFAAGDESVLDGVYVAGSAPLVADSGRIRELSAAGYRIDGAVHVIVSAERLDSTLDNTDADLLVTVVDSMPSYPVRDATGRVVGQTVATDRTTRTLQLVAVAGSGYRIASIR